MKSLFDLFAAILLDAGRQVSVDVAADLRKAQRRWESEGEQFLTVTLPRFGHAVRSALERGNIASVPFPNFRKRNGYPLFLGGMLRRVFSSDGCVVLDEQAADAIRAIAQVTLAFEKIFEVCDPKREAQSVASFVQCERDLEDAYYFRERLHRLGSVACRHLGDSLAAIDEAVYRGELIPRHGPGATADRLRGNAKFDNACWSVRLQGLLPFGDYIYPGRAESCNPPDLKIYEPGLEPPVRVVTVPKTASKARVIAIEPTYRQYAQQALLREFMKHFGDGDFLALRRQDLNQQMALTGSVDRSLATIDLSEASDRVHVDVVRAVFGRFPHLLEALLASRGETASLPSGEVIPLLKFASMGSATCFPVQSVVFLVIAIDAIEQAANGTSWRSISKQELRNTLRVFGDDIIVPTRFADAVLRALVELGARPNSTKTFIRGHFRESCGGEFFAGYDVSYAKLRRRVPNSRRDAESVVAYSAFRNHLYQRGFWGAAKAIDDDLEVILRGMYPIVEPTSPVVGRTSVFQYRAQAFHRRTSAPLVRGWTLRAPAPRSIASERGALLKCTLPDRHMPFEDRRHLERSGDRKSVV